MTNQAHPSYQPVHFYPYDTNLDDLHSTNNHYGTIKKFHILRHAEGTHNVNKEYKDLKNLDARLTELGQDQCRQLAQCLSTQEFVSRIDLVVTSPLTRCLQTALFSFPMLSTHIPFLAHESIRETVNYACDRRRTIRELQAEFPNRIDFSLCPEDKDAIWEAYDQRLGTDHTKHRESAELHVVADRARDFFQWVSSRSEQEIVVCTHSAFLRAFLNWGQEGGVPQQMEQCLDERELKVELPVVQYGGGNAEWEAFMRSDYENCELRSCIVAFPRTEEANNSK
jgi:broad specificity phosphatase PhoE